MYSLLLALLLSIPIAGNVFAETVEIIPVKFAYARVTRQVDVHSTSKVVFYARTKGNVSDRFSVRISAPRGARVYLRGLKGTRRFAGSNRDFRRSYPVFTEARDAQQARESQCIEFSPGEIADTEEYTKREDDNPICGLFSPEEIGELARGLALTYGGSWTPGHVCGFIVDNYLGGAGECDWANPTPECQVILDELFGGTPPPPIGQARSATQSALSMSGVFSKDACASADEPYIFAVYVDLSRVSKAGGPRVATISYLGQTRARQGGREASIKPVSDGKYAPRPLLLMRSLGACGQSLRLVEWGPSRPVKLTSMRPYDMLPYHGMVLNRTPLGPSELRGGSGTFELSTSYESYGVCMSLVAQRQRVNGYPGSGE